jgi:hypothetical protein
LIYVHFAKKNASTPCKNFNYAIADFHWLGALQVLLEGKAFFALHNHNLESAGLSPIITLFCGNPPP